MQIRLFSLSLIRAAVSAGAVLLLAGIISLMTSVPVGAETINDGDLIRPAGDYRVYVVKKSGGKTFARHIVSPDIFSFYGHFNFAAVKSVPSLAGYTLSAWVRAVGNPKVYEINADGTAHWMTCDDDYGFDDGHCGNEWAAVGGDPYGVYEINSAEMGWYTISNPKVLVDVND